MVKFTPLLVSSQRTNTRTHVQASSQDSERSWSSWRLAEAHYMYLDGGCVCRRNWKAVKPGVAVGNASDATDRTEKSGGKRIRIVSFA